MPNQNRSAIPDDRGRARGRDPMPRTGTSASAHFMSVLGRSVPLVLALSRTLPVKLARAGRIFLHLALFQYFPPSSSPFAPCQWSKHHTPPSPPAKTRPGFLWHPSPPFFPPTLFQGPYPLSLFPLPTSRAPHLSVTITPLPSLQPLPSQALHPGCKKTWEAQTTPTANRRLFLFSLFGACRESLQRGPSFCL